MVLGQRTVDFGKTCNNREWYAPYISAILILDTFTSEPLSIAPGHSAVNFLRDKEDSSAATFCSQSSINDP